MLRMLAEGKKQWNSCDKEIRYFSLIGCQGISYSGQALGQSGELDVAQRKGDRTAATTTYHRLIK